MTWNSVPDMTLAVGKISKERKNFTTRRMRQKEILLQEEYYRKPSLVPGGCAEE